MNRLQQGTQSASQQQVASQQPIHQIGQMNPHSECVLPQQVPLNAPQSHRPFVPHGSRDYSPRKNLHATLQNPAQIAPASQSGAQQVPIMDQGQGKNEDQINGSDVDYDKQPVGGRNAAFYRKIMINRQGHPQSQPSVEPVALSQANVNPQHVHNQYSTHGDVTQQSPQQIYQQMQQNMVQQQQMQQKATNYQMQMINGQQQMENNQGSPYTNTSQQFGRHFSSQGTTSPQGVTANQIRNSRMMNHPMYQRDLDYSTNPQSAWSRNNQVSEYSNAKAQLKAYNVEVVGGNQPQYRMQSQQQQQQFLPQYQHQPVHQHQQMYRNPGQGNMPMQRQQNVVYNNQPAGGFNQQLSSNQQAINQQPIIQQQNFQQSIPQPNIQQPIENRNAQFENRASKFTVGMIRDQEKLLAAMKQQGIPMDIMKRQFDGLLNEQRKFLDYLERKQQPDASEGKRPQQQQRMNEMSPQQVPVQAMNQQNYQHWQRQQQQQQQQNHNWQPQQPAQQHYSNMYSQPYAVSNPGNVNEPEKRVNYQQNVPQYQYTHQHPYQQQFHPQMQQYQQYYQNIPAKNLEQARSTNMPVYNDNRPSSEPSSLLKLRQYKNEVRPQRRNNGLQDPSEAKRQLEELRVSAEDRKGLEYLANMSSKRCTAKLNGMQERDDLEAEFQQRLITAGMQPPAKIMSANGLENSRNPDNPPPRRLSNLKRMEQEYTREYPRQKQNNLRNCYSVQAERENGTVAVDQQQMYSQQQFQNSTNVIPYNEKNPMMARGTVMPFRFDGSYPQHYQQMQQYYQNAKNISSNNGEGDLGSTQKIEQNKGGFDRAGGDANENMNNMMNTQMAEGKMAYQGMYYSQPNIHEARTIGGVRYLARKQDYIPNQQVIAPETLIANRHLQPPIIY
ncbi:hypothetical protein WH47_06019 [Habropoda laboriosa]|uniref:Uncharacterized protein n=1 Tax=Habropoda laboriosa TaxID=597456 RepID=A0A0L7QRV2_9HYME|nr:hypothetical protein WH47_06019 [Habropoda laboriosa]